jgi:hypothetical protein
MHHNMHSMFCLDHSWADSVQVCSFTEIMSVIHSLGSYWVKLADVYHGMPVLYHEVYWMNKLKSRSYGKKWSPTFLSQQLEYLMWQVARKLQYICIMKSIRRYSLRGCSIGITDWRDLWSKSLRCVPNLMKTGSGIPVILWLLFQQFETLLC